MNAIIPRMIEDTLEGTNLHVGLAATVFAAAAICVRPWLARFSEHVGLRLTMSVGVAVTAVATTGLMFVADRWWVLPVRGLQGIGEAALFVGGTALTTGAAPASRRAEAASYFSVAVFGGIGLGPVLAEFVTDRNPTRPEQYHGAIAVALVFVAVSLLLTWFVARDRPSASERAARRHGPRPPALHPVALRPGFVLAFAMAGFVTFNSFVPKHAVNVGLPGAAGVFALYSVVCLAIRVFGARLPERVGLQRTSTAALCWLAIGLLVLAVWGRPAGVFVGAAVMGLGMSLLYPALQAMTMNAVDDAGRIRAIATFTMFFEVGSVAGGALFGWLADVTSKQGAFFGGALSCVAGVAFLWRVAIPSLRAGGSTEVHAADIVSAS